MRPVLLYSVYPGGRVGSHGEKDKRQWGWTINMEGRRGRRESGLCMKILWGILREVFREVLPPPFARPHIHSVPGHVIAVFPLGNPWGNLEFSQRQ